MHAKKFIICGLAGWCIEIAFTAFSGALKKDRKLMGKTSAWMFPIYGMAAAIHWVYPRIKHLSKLFRGLIYGISIMTCEYLSGSLLTRLKVCPWNYEGCKYSIRGLVRMDFLPLWAIAGLFYEWLLLHITTEDFTQDA